MRCYVFCAASSYNTKALYEYLKGQYVTTLYRDVIHVAYPNKESLNGIFYFPYGSTVCWGLTEAEEIQFLHEVKPFEILPLDDIERDTFSFSYGEPPKLDKDDIVLPNYETLTKLAISHGLAQSVKLSTFENGIQKSFNLTRQIPMNLAVQGKISLSRHEIRRKMGEIFLERSSVNLHLDILDTPEFFWDRPELEPLYKLAASYLDIATRVEVLNQRLDVLQELFQVLANELNHQHASRLEWTIIWLIILEVCLTLFRDVFRII